MISITTRFREDDVAYVRRIARERRVNDAEIWRELIDKGIYQHHAEEHRLYMLLRVAVKTLSAVRRLTEHVDPTLLEIAENDAYEALRKENSL